MAIDYYYVLGLKRTSSKIEILHAIQKIIHKFGMEKLNDDDTNQRLIAFEAYDVLSDSFWRENYDQFGSLTIKLGIFVENEQKIKRYSYHNDIFSTYKSIYGSINPHAHKIYVLTNMKINQINIKNTYFKIIPINLTLNEIFFGTSKKINVPKSDGSICIADVFISKGLPANSEIIHILPDGRTVTFMTNDLPHKHFVRCGQDLISTYNVTIKEMMFGVQYVIKTLDHKILRVNITEMITPTYQKVIQGEGMPACGNNCVKRGDIILRFKIEMPLYHPGINKTICEYMLETNINEEEQK